MTSLHSDQPNRCASCSHALPKSILENLEKKPFSVDCPECGISLSSTCPGCPTVLTIAVLECLPCEQRRRKEVLDRMDLDQQLQETTEKAERHEQNMKEVEKAVRETVETATVVTVTLAVMGMTGVMHWLLRLFLSPAWIYLACIVAGFVLVLLWRAVRKKSLQLGRIQSDDDFSYFPLTQKMIVAGLISCPLLILANFIVTS